MYRRVLTAWLITLALATGSIAYVRVQEPETGAYEEKLNAEEEREAVQVAERFTKSFEEKNDPSSLIDQLYVKDFDARLRSDPNTFIYLAKLEPEVVAEASDKELRRLYAASLNFIYASGLLYGINLYNRRMKGVEADDDGDTPLGELLPPGVMAVLKGDPLMGGLIAEDEERERERKSGQMDDQAEPEASEGSGKKDAADGPEIRSLERLRGFISTLEKAALLLREHLRTVQGPQGWKELSNALRALGVEDEESCEGVCPRVHTLNEEFFGSPAGTRLFCVNVMVFHMDLIRVDGRLRILNVYMADD